MTGALRFVNLLPLLLAGCSYTVEREHFRVEAEEGFFRSYVYTEILKDGKPVDGSGKLTICNGVAGFVSDVMQNAAIVGSAALIGAGIGDSGDSNTTSLNNSSQSQSSAHQSQSQSQRQQQRQFQKSQASSTSNANANSTATGGQNSGSGSGGGWPKPHKGH